jgi:hypothetical protein
MREKLLVAGAGLILVYLAWAWGGLQQAWLLPAVWTAAGLLIALLISATSCLKWLWRDVFFYGGLLFLGYLTLQWWNAGRVLFFDVGLREWRYAAPPYPGWPSAFNKADAVQMLTWFFPAWVLGLVVRSPGIESRALLKLLRALVYGAGVLSLVGIIQFVTHAKARYWVRPTDEFFASFGYTNHAAAYFVLMGAVAAGLLYKEIFNVGGALRTAIDTGRRLVEPVATRSAPPTLKRNQSRVVALAASMVLCLVGASLSLSRAGVILAWALAGFVAIYGLVKGWRRLRRVSRLNLAVATIAILFIFYFAVAGFGKKEILQEFAVRKPIHHRLCPALDKVNLALSDRPLLVAVALQMWRDNPIYGVGGWGFSHLLALYLPREEWTYVQYPGRANVHCDIFQFLAEFGVVGFGLMLVAPLILIVSLFQKTNRRDPLWVMGFIGLSLVVIFSLIDLPFRCPAILCTWLVILAALPKATEVRIQESRNQNPQ